MNPVLPLDMATINSNKLHSCVEQSVGWLRLIPEQYLSRSLTTLVLQMIAEMKLIHKKLNLKYAAAPMMIHMYTENKILRDMQTPFMVLSPLLTYCTNKQD